MNRPDLALAPAVTPAPTTETPPQAQPPIALAALGVALPETSVTQAGLADAAVPCNCTTDRQARTLRALYRRAGPKRRGCAILDPSDPHNPSPRRITDAFPPARHPQDRGPTLAARMALYRQAAPPLARRAATQALHRAAQAQSLPHEPFTQGIAHLVTVSCTGFAAPGLDTDLIQHLGLCPHVSRTHVGFLGCHAALNGYQTADALAARTGQPALLVCVEVCTAHFAYGHDPQALVANALFADAAAAAVLMPRVSLPNRAGRRDAPHVPTTPASTPPLQLADRFSAILPDTQHAMTWHPGDHGFEMTLAPEVPDLIAKHAGPMLLPWLARHGITSADLAAGRLPTVLHPGGPRILQAAADALKLPDQTPGLPESHAVLCEHGNCSSPTVLMTLDRLLNSTQPDKTNPQRRAGPGSPILLLAFGPGLAIEAMLLRHRNPRAF